MTRLQLSSTAREDLRKSVTKKLRREGEIPATVYGRGDPARSVAVKADEVVKILRAPGGLVSLIDLKVDGKISKAHPVLIQEIQRDPISRKILHIDFHRVSMDEPVHASVPIVLFGDAPGIKQGGMLEQFTYQLEIKTLPDNIPSHIDVDVSGLELGQSIHVGDVQVPEGVEVLGPLADNVVATVRLPVVHIEAEEAAPEAEEAEAAEEAAAGAEGESTGEEA